MSSSVYSRSLPTAMPFGEGADEKFIPAGKFLEDVISRGVAFDGGTEGKDDFFHGRMGYPFQQARDMQVGRSDAVHGRDDAPEDVVKPAILSRGFKGHDVLDVSTTQMVWASRLGSEQSSQISSSEMLWHCRHSRMDSFRAVMLSVNCFTSSGFAEAYATRSARLFYALFPGGRQIVQPLFPVVWTIKIAFLLLLFEF